MDVALTIKNRKQITKEKLTNARNLKIVHIKKQHKYLKDMFNTENVREQLDDQAKVDIESVC